MSKAAFIGLGAMGSRMAANLIKAGHEVTVCDLAPEAVKRLADSGAKTATSAREAASSPVATSARLPASTTTAKWSAKQPPRAGISTLPSGHLTTAKVTTMKGDTSETNRTIVTVAVRAMSSSSNLSASFVNAPATWPPPARPSPPTCRSTRGCLDVPLG
jgi:pyrroline-5-carboxylate reductase